MGESDPDPATLYELVQCLGEGTYGTVWRARDRNTQEIVAVKIIPIEDDSSSLQQEINILRRCDYSHIVRYLGSYEKDSDVWIVMELCEPGSVADVMNMAGVTLNEKQIKVICASVLLCLKYLHSMNVIHRDVKAGNILLTKDGKAKIADFGVSAQLSTVHSHTDTAIGAPFWMAPEVIQEESYNGRADIWSLGIALIEMGDGRPPHSDLHPVRAVFMIPSSPPPKMNEPSAWSSQLNDFLSQCLQKEPSDRMDASALMKHPFVKDAVAALLKSDGKSQVILDLVQNNMQTIEAYRQSQQNNENEGLDNTLVSSIQGTLVTSQNSNSGSAVAAGAAD